MGVPSGETSDDVRILWFRGRIGRMCYVAQKQIPIMQFQVLSLIFLDEVVKL